MPKSSELIAERLDAQLLSGPPASSPEEVVERLLAVQAQDARGARLTVRSRSTGLHATDLDDALTDRRSMVVTWLNRGTLHLVSAADYWWLHPITTPQLATTNRRRLHQEGVSDTEAERGVDIVVDAVGTHGPQTRAELRRRLETAGIPTAEQAFIHVLFAASLRGDIVRGPMRGAEHAFVAASDWLGKAPPPLERPEALARLARRYLAGHAPAEARDLAKWAKVTLGDARAAFDGIRGELVERPEGRVALANGRAPAPIPEPRLLGAFDPLLLGWESRELLVGAHNLVTSNGVFRPFALVDGRAVATWRLSGRTLSVKPLKRLKAATVEALRADAAGLSQYLGMAGPAEVVFEPYE